MAISITDVELAKYDLVAGTPVSVAIPAFVDSEIVIYYGNARVLAVIGVDYTIQFDNYLDVDPVWPSTFSFTPTATLIAEIDALILADPTEANIAFVHRTLPYTSDFAETDGFLRAKIAKEFDRTIMRMQQLAYDFSLITGLATAKADAETAAAASAASATASAASATLASQWAELLDGLVATVGYSAKEWAVGTFTRGMAGLGSAKDWATYVAGTVDGVEFSSKYYAQLAEAYAATLTSPWSFAGDFDPSGGSFPAVDGSGNPVQKGFVFIVTVDGTVDGQFFSSGDELVAKVDNPSTVTYAGNWVRLQGALTAGEIVTALGFNPLDAALKATAAEVVTGTDDAKYVTSAALAGAGIGPSPLTKSYTSTNQTPTQGGLVTLAHGLGAMPALVQARIVITTAIGPYALNDEIIIDNNFSSNVQGYGRGVSMKIDATNIYVRFGGTDATMDLVNPGDGSVGSINYANFKLVVRAWA